MLCILIIFTLLSLISPRSALLPYHPTLWPVWGRLFLFKLSIPFFWMCGFWLDHSQSTKGHTLKKTEDPSHSIFQSPAAPHLETELHAYLLFASWEFCHTWACTGLIHDVTTNKDSFAQPALMWSENTIFLQPSTTSGSYTSHPPSQWSLSFVEKGYHIGVPFVAGNSAGRIMINTETHRQRIRDCGRLWTSVIGFPTEVLEPKMVMLMDL